jgi:uncharacterized protein
MMIVYSATKQQFVNDVRSNAIAALIQDYSETVRNESIALLLCAYLHNMKARDAITDDGSLWLIAENSVEQIGCMHTCQPLEHPSRDKALSGIRGRLKKEPEVALTAATEVIKNTYRTLMTRGQKGCFIYCTDQETREYFQQIACRQLEQKDPAELEASNAHSRSYRGLDLPVVSFEQAKPYQGYVPIFDLEIAAQNNEWVQLPEHINTTQGMFVTRVVGESMNKRIINGSWCLFKANPGGSRNGKIVLVQHRDIEDPDHGGTYTVKTYHSEKIEEDGVLVNQRIVLKPETNAYGYSPIFIGNDGEELVVVGEFLSVM